MQPKRPDCAGQTTCLRGGFHCKIKVTLNNWDFLFVDDNLHLFDDLRNFWPKLIYDVVQLLESKNLQLGHWFIEQGNDSSCGEAEKYDKFRKFFFLGYNDFAKYSTTWLISSIHIQPNALHLTCRRDIHYHLDYLFLIHLFILYFSKILPIKKYSESLKTTFFSLSEIFVKLSKASLCKFISDELVLIVCDKIWINYCQDFFHKFIQTRLFLADFV